MAAPTELRTARLLLRPFKPGDVDDALAYRNDAEFARFLAHVPQPFTRQHAQELVALNMSEPWDQSPTFAVVLGGKLIGTVNLEVDAEKRAAMLGYAIGRAWWGQGIATEAARAVVAWAIATFDLVRIRASTDVRHVRSQRVMEKLGMKREGVVVGHHPGRNGEPIDEVAYALDLTGRVAELTTELTTERRARIERWAGEPIAAVGVASRGYTPAARFLVTLASGKTAFVKVATTPLTADFLRLEASVYRAMSAPFMPQCLGFEDHASEPLLVLEDLRAAHWPPPWNESLVAEVQQTLAVVHSSRAPLRRFAHAHPGFPDGWTEVQNDPAPFLSLGLASREWLERALPVLLSASAALQTDGDEVIHLDVRSDNLCRASRGVVLIDWNHACLGNGELDTGFWLPSLESEGGPLPETVLPKSPEVAASVSGFFAARAGLPLIPDAPRVRVVQLEQLGPALRWAARALGLPQLDGPLHPGVGS